MCLSHSASLKDLFAILFFSGFGPGLISGFFALYLYTTGVITKVYVDVLESVETDYGLYGKIFRKSTPY